MKFRLLSAALATLLSTTAFTAESTQPYGVVNFSTCVTDSKLGQQEQASYEALKKQMSSLLEDTEKQLNDLTAKFNDPDYLDGLSPEAEDELKTKFRTLNDDMNRYQNQFYQVMNQANQRIIQTLANNINTASEKVGKDKKLSFVLNKEACFYYASNLDITKEIVTEMDRTFVPDTKKPMSPPPPTSANETQQKPLDLKQPSLSPAVKNVVENAKTPATANAVENDKAEKKKK